MGYFLTGCSPKCNPNRETNRLASLWPLGVEVKMCAASPPHLYTLTLWP